MRYERNCNVCNLYYEGRGQFCCSRLCSNKSLERAKKISKNNAKGFLGKKHTTKNLTLISRANVGRIISKEIRDKMSKSHEGELAYNWKGENVSYRVLHRWVRRKLGVPKLCEHCDNPR